MKELRFLFDDRHGWLRVPLAEYWRSDIHEQVSKYSYADDRHVYLEEDADAGLFLEALGIDADEVRERCLRGPFPLSVSRDIVRFDQRRPAPPVATAGKEAAR